MKNSFEWLRRVQLPLLAAVSLAPLGLAVFAFIAPERMAMAWWYPVCFGLLAVVSLWLPDRFRMPWGFCGSGLLLVAGGLLAKETDSLLALLPVVIFIFLLFYSLRFGRFQWNEEISQLFGWTGIVFYVFAQVLMALLELDDAGSGITVGFLAFVLLFLLSMNRNTLNGATVRQHRASGNVRHKNRILVLSFFLLVGIVMSVPSLLQGIGKGIIWLISAIYNLFQEHTEPATPGPPLQGGQQLLPGGNIQGTGFAQAMTHVQNALVTVLAYVGPLLLCYVLLRKLPWLIRMIGKFFSFYRLGKAEEREGYVEEITNIRSKKTGFPKGNKAKKPRMRRRNLTPSQKIRYQYGLLRRRHSQWHDSSTARENLSADMAAIYEKTRYGGVDATEPEAEAFLTGTKGL